VAGDPMCQTANYRNTMAKSVRDRRSSTATLSRHGGSATGRASNGHVPPLVAAVLDGEEIAVELLIARGTGIDSQTANGITPLLAAASEGRTAIVRGLIAAGADVNRADLDGWTPLMAAAARESTEISEMLVAAGANVNATLRKGATAIDLARAGGYTETELWLRRVAIDQAIRLDSTQPLFEHLGTSLYSIDHPAGWRPYHQGTSPEIAVAAPGAILQDTELKVGYGAILSYYPVDEGRATLAAATEDLIRDLLRENPDLRVVSAPAPAETKDGPALMNWLTGDSPFGGQVSELVATALRPEGLFCLFFVAPKEALPKVRPVFHRMHSSLQFTMHSYGFSA